MSNSSTKKNKKLYFTPAYFRSRKQFVASSAFDTPTKRATGISSRDAVLTITTPTKPLQVQEQIKNKWLSFIRKMEKQKKRYLPSNEEINCAFLHDKFTADELSLLKNTVIPDSILSPVHTKELIFHPKRQKLSRTSANRVHGCTAKEAMQDVIKIINNCAQLENKAIFNKFIKLYDAADVKNSIIPSAEWCHMIALSLSHDQKSAMSLDNLFAATAMVNTKMINFEAAAKRLYNSDTYKVKITTNFVTFKGTHVLAKLTQRLTLTDRDGKAQIFEQVINPFEVTSVTQSSTIDDPCYTYNFIKNNMQRHDLKHIARKKQDLKRTSSDVLLHTFGVLCPKKLNFGG